MDGLRQVHVYSVHNHYVVGNYSNLFWPWLLVYRYFLNDGLIIIIATPADIIPVAITV